MTLYQAKFEMSSVFESLDDAWPREDVHIGTPMVYLGEQHQSGAGEYWLYLKVLLPSGFVGWILNANTEEMA
jgi:hypothetical protein